MDRHTISRFYVVFVWFCAELCRCKKKSKIFCHLIFLKNKKRSKSGRCTAEIADSNSALFWSWWFAVFCALAAIACTVRRCAD